MALFLGSPVWAQHGGHGGGHGGGGHGGGGHVSFGHAGGGHVGAAHVGGGHSVGGFGVGHAGGFAGAYHYGNGYRSYYGGGRGFYRPYYGGWGFYLPYYGGYYPYDYGYTSYGDYTPYYDGYSSYPLGSDYVGAYNPSAADVQSQAPSPGDRPPADDAAHLRLIVPENATILVDGTATTQTGSVRDFVTTTLTPGARYKYQISVRYTNAQGKAVDDTRDIRFQANDWFVVDFTQPPPARPAPAPAAQPLPRAGREPG
jgi:uncharacterized protein (TIGR03000 family)